MWLVRNICDFLVPFLAKNLVDYFKSKNGKMSPLESVL